MLCVVDQWPCVDSASRIVLWYTECVIFVTGLQTMNTDWEWVSAACTTTMQSMYKHRVQCIQTHSDGQFGAVWLRQTLLKPHLTSRYYPWASDASTLLLEWEVTPTDEHHCIRNFNIQFSGPNGSHWEEEIPGENNSHYFTGLQLILYFRSTHTVLQPTFLMIKLILN